MPAGGSYVRNDMWIELRKKVKKVTTYHYFYLALCSFNKIKPIQTHFVRSLQYPNNKYHYKPTQ